MKSEAQLTNSRFLVSYTIKNTGKVKGTEIVQLYVSPIDENSTLKPIKLLGFNRVTLDVGETKEVVFKVSPQQLVQFKNNRWIVEANTYEFKIGASSTDIRLKDKIELKGKDLILENGRTIFFSEHAFNKE